MEEVNKIEFTELTIKLLVLFLPGIIATAIIDVLTTHRRRQVFHFVIHSYLLGMISYLLLYLIVKINNQIVEWRSLIPTWETSFITSLLDSRKEVNPFEVFAASILAALIAMITVKIINEKWGYNIARRLKLSSKNGDGDVWDYVVGSNDVEWINIRNLNEGIIYQGRVQAYSEKDEKRELLLSKVQVFKDCDTGTTYLYEMSFMYFDFDINSEIRIEIYSKEENNGEENTEDYSGAES